MDASTSLPSNTEKSTVQVGERTFHTTRSTLDDSLYFSAFFKRWNHRPLLEGTLFIDRDGDIFAHILRYLRSGILPIFFNLKMGHDIMLYQAVLAEARYFGIPTLEAWIEEKKYIKAVRTGHVFRDEVVVMDDKQRISSAAMLEYFFTRHTTKVYLCPRNIFVHRGAPERCGRDCRKVRGNEDPQYGDEAVTHCVFVEKFFDVARDCIEGQSSNFFDTDM